MLWKRKQVNRGQRIATWLQAQPYPGIQDQFFGQKTPECPPDEFLLEFLQERKPSLADARALHVLDCNYCMARVEAMRKTENAGGVETARPFWPWVLGAFAVVLVIALVIIRPRPTVERGGGNVASVSADMDLSKYPAVRGETAPAKQLASLPRAKVHLHLTLPPLSQSGKYKVTIEGDAERQLMDRQATTSGAGLYLTLDVSLDLHALEPGGYLLSTEHIDDGVIYRYPIEIGR